VRLLADLPTTRVFLPSYSPELNPAERIFEEIRRRVQGQVYVSVADKQAVADAYLRELAADPGRVKRLCGWAWLHDALDQLPPTQPRTGWRPPPGGTRSRTAPASPAGRDAASAPQR
jgi:hypothetical protein